MNTALRTHGRRLAHALAAAALGATAVVTVATPSALAQEATRIPGIDVSHWQGTIDWDQVAASGVEFAFIKATDGIDGATFLDDQYAINVAGARGNGIKVGAYHFARPDLDSPDDALVEARWFVNNLDLRAGDLPPVLDIEVNYGLSVDQMVAWAMTWLDEVRRLTGVSPLVYTSPSGWETRFGDSTEIAEAGYDLWLAHWTNQQPRVPAEGWAGRSWTIWQYSSKGTVPGITGKVDMDWSSVPLADLVVRGLTVTLTGAAGSVTSEPAGIECGDDCEGLFDPGTEVSLVVTAPQGSYLKSFAGDCSGRLDCSVVLDQDREVILNFGADTTPPNFTLETPAAAGEPVVVRFSEPVSGVHPQDLGLARAAGGTVQTSLGCHAKDGSEISCEEGAVRRVDLTPLDPLGSGQRFKVTINTGGGEIHDRALNPVAASTVEFISAADIEDSTGDVTFAWREVKAKGAKGGRYVVERTPGAEASFDFTGPSIGWITVTGPAFGEAEVFVDGDSKGTVDLGASVTTYGVTKTFRGLGSGAHTLTIRVVGGGQVAVDAFRVGKIIELAPALDLAWASVTSSAASAGTYAVSDLGKTRAVVRFSGSAITWLSLVGPDMGQARVTIDGIVVRTVNNFAQTAGRKNWRFEGLGGGEHVLVIEVLGTSAQGATGTRVAIDGFVVSG